MKCWASSAGQGQSQCQGQGQGQVRAVLKMLLIKRDSKHMFNVIKGIQDLQ